MTVNLYPIQFLTDCSDYPNFINVWAWDEYDALAEFSNHPACIGVDRSSISVCEPIASDFSFVPPITE